MGKISEKAREGFLREAGLVQLPGMLDLTRARLLDRILTGELAEDDKILRDLLQQRNGSILAHGLNPISEGSANRFLEYVDTMVDKPRIRLHPSLEGL